MGQDSKQLFEDMAERQKRHDFIVVVHGVVGGDGRSHPDTVFVTEHGTLGGAGGSGGINEDGKIL